MIMKTREMEIQELKLNNYFEFQNVIDSLHNRKNYPVVCRKVALSLIPYNKFLHSLTIWLNQDPGFISSWLHLALIDPHFDFL